MIEMQRFMAGNFAAKRVCLRDGEWVLIRPVQPDDDHLYRDFFPLVTAEDIRLRFFGTVKAVADDFIARLTHLDRARAIAFVAIDEVTGAMLGVVRLHASADFDRAEFGILVRSDLKGHGLGWVLMQHMIDYARAEGIKIVEGKVLVANTMMLAMCTEIGFAVVRDPDDPQVRSVTLLVPAPVDP